MGLFERWRRMEIHEKIAIVAVVQWPIVVLIGMVLYWTGIVR